VLRWYDDEPQFRLKGRRDDSMNDSTQTTSDVTGPWTIRSPEWGLLRFLPALTIINFVLFLWCSWVAYDVWHDTQSNVILAHDPPAVSAACNFLSISGGLAAVYGAMFYIETSGWDWRAASQSTGLVTSQSTEVVKRAPNDRIVLGLGLYR
jgi:hypothetical protein